MEVVSNSIAPAVEGCWDVYLVVEFVEEVEVDQLQNFFVAFVSVCRDHSFHDLDQLQYLGAHEGVLLY